MQDFECYLGGKHKIQVRANRDVEGWQGALKASTSGDSELTFKKHIRQVYYFMGCVTLKTKQQFPGSGPLVLELAHTSWRAT